MNKSGTFINSDALKWALDKMRMLKRDQLALFYCLALAKEPEVRPTKDLNNPFLSELLKYLGAPIRGGGVGIFNPIQSEWRAEAYLYSTVFGALMNGSHWWTGPEGFLRRDPAMGWPAYISFDESGFKKLLKRTSMPNLAHENRLQMLATAILYFKQEDLSAYGLSVASSESDLSELYESRVLNARPELIGLFREDDPYLFDAVFDSAPLPENIIASCYPRSPHASEPKKNILVYTDDIEILQKMSAGDEMIADTVRRLIERGKANDSEANNS